MTRREFSSMKGNQLLSSFPSIPPNGTAPALAVSLASTLPRCVALACRTRSLSPIISRPSSSPVCTLTPPSVSGVETVSCRRSGPGSSRHRVRLSVLTRRSMTAYCVSSTTSLPSSVWMPLAPALFLMVTLRPVSTEQRASSMPACRSPGAMAVRSSAGAPPSVSTLRAAAVGVIWPSVMTTLCTGKAPGRCRMTS